MAEAEIAVSVVVPCRNEMPHVEHAMRSILACEPPPGDFEVVVADGMSTDGTREVLDRLSQQDPRLRVIDNPGRIVSTGLNAAIRAARGEIIVRMDGHSEYAPDYVRQSVAILEQTGADNVGGPTRTRAEGYLQRAVAAAYHSFFSVGGAKFHDVDYEGPLDTVTYGCWRRTVFERVGLFDEEMVRNQDDEFNLRLTRAGGVVWQSPRIKHWYRPRASLRALFRQYMQYGYWKVRVIRKHKLPASWRHLVPATFLSALIALALLAPFASAARGAWLAIVGLYVAGLFWASMLTAARSGPDLFPVLPAVFWCYHFGYGYGFLNGIVDAFGRRQGTCTAFTALTRGDSRSVGARASASATRE